eukprot:gene9225-biopygen13748
MLPTSVLILCVRAFERTHVPRRAPAQRRGVGRCVGCATPAARRRALRTAQGKTEAGADRARAARWNSKKRARAGRGRGRFSHRKLCHQCD